jgi:hypothetical protein
MSEIDSELISLSVVEVTVSSANKFTGKLPIIIVAINNLPNLIFIFLLLKNDYISIYSIANSLQ